MSRLDRQTHLDYAALFDAAPSPLLAVDRDLVIVEANRAYCDVVGRPRDELIGPPLFEVFPTNPADPAGDGVSNLRASLERARDTGRPDTMAVQEYDIEVAGTATRYRPGEDALSVSGDWFDVVQLAEDAVALAVGDVVGKGLRSSPS